MVSVLCSTVVNDFGAVSLLNFDVVSANFTLVSTNLGAANARFDFDRLGWSRWRRFRQWMEFVDFSLPPSVCWSYGVRCRFLVYRRVLQHSGSAAQL